jgi:hypothetical protein
MPKKQYISKVSKINIHASTTTCPENVFISTRYGLRFSKVLG